MKNPAKVGVLVLVLIALVLGLSLYYSTLGNPAGSDKDQMEQPNSPVSAEGQLKINNLAAYSNGTVSFDVTLYDCDSGLIEVVIINGDSYMWSEGCSEDGLILKGETKSWSKNIGVLGTGSKIEVALRASPEEVSGSVIVADSSVQKIPDEPSVPDLPKYYYDSYSAVSLFDRGVYFVATNVDPLTQLPRSDLPRSIWELMRENVTIQATDQDFMSVLVCRGDLPSGGYTLSVESFSWLESYPVKLRFQVNFTDPGEGVPVTLAFTNPSVLVPLGQLAPGKYQVEIHIVSYILTYDDQGRPNYRPIMTFREEVWTQTLTVTKAQTPASSTTFKVVVNTNQFQDLEVPVDLSSGVTREKAELIAKSTFVHVMGEKTFSRLDDLTFSDKQISARFTWGVDQNDLGHIFELTVDLAALQMAVIHCL